MSNSCANLGEFKPFNTECAPGNNITSKIIPAKKPAQLDISNDPRRYIAGVMKSNMPAETKDKIITKFGEITKKNPKMKMHRAMRKAAEFYKIKLKFTA